VRDGPYLSFHGDVRRGILRELRELRELCSPCRMQ
jgi:hypothetical protein